MESLITCVLSFLSLNMESLIKSEHGVSDYMC